MPKVQLDDGRLFYREAGQGSLAIFIHGYPLDHRVWLGQIAGLAATRRCVALDLRGHGRSDPVPRDSLPMELLAADVAAVVTALGDDAADVVGLSMGGYVALALWEAHPEVVRSLTLVDTRAGADGPEARQARDAAAARIVERGRSALADELLPNLLATGASAGARARLRTMVEETPYETALAVLAGMRDRKDRSALLGGITVPTLVVAGAEDRLIPADQAVSLAAAVPGARLEVVSGAGHLPPLEAPETFNRVLKGFWSEAD